MGPLLNHQHIITHFKFSLQMIVTKSMHICGLSRLSRNVITASQLSETGRQNKNRVRSNAGSGNAGRETIRNGDLEIVINPEQLNQRTHHGDSTHTTFESLNIRSDVITGLESDGVGQPTLMQTQGIPMVMEGKNVFCAGQTGSGKTYVYVAPIVNAIQDKSDQGYVRRLSRPTALVVTPSRLLTAQILRVFQKMTPFVPIRSLGVIGQNQKAWTRGYSRGLVDVVVATPGLLLKFHHRENVIFSDLRYLVLDEADTLMDENFREATERILELCKVQDYHP